MARELACSAHCSRRFGCPLTNWQRTLRFQDGPARGYIRHLRQERVGYGAVPGYYVCAEPRTPPAAWAATESKAQRRRPSSQTVATAVRVSESSSTTRAKGREPAQREPRAISSPLKQKRLAATSSSDVAAPAAESCSDPASLREHRSPAPCRVVAPPAARPHRDART